MVLRPTGIAIFAATQDSPKTLPLQPKPIVYSYAAEQAAEWLTLRYTADLRSIGFIALHACINASLWYFPMNSYLFAALYTSLLLLGCSVGTIVHNSIHVPPFKSIWMGRLFRMALTISFGHPVSTFVPAHNLSHHQYQQLPEDYMRTDKVRYKSQLANLVMFYFRVAPPMMNEDIRYMKLQKKLGNRIYNQALEELVVLVVVMAASVYLSWKKHLVFWMLPRFCASFFIVTINLLQHDGCEDEEPHSRTVLRDLDTTGMNTARNFVDSSLNWWVFNNGYHTIHHLRPAMHWSKLPTEHLKHVHPRIHPALEQKSIFSYLFTQFVYPGERVRYDGKPVVFLKSAEEDVPWF